MSTGTGPTTEPATSSSATPTPTTPSSTDGRGPFERRWEGYLQGLRRLSPVHSNRASELGHPCLRHLWYRRTAWEKAALPDTRLQGILEFGKDYEDVLLNRLRAAGFRIRRQQVAVQWKEYDITGHPDGEISADDGQSWLLFDVKGLHPLFYDRVNHWRDFLSMGPIYSKYPGQLQLYCLMENVERAVFVVGRKGAYEVKFLPMELDYGYAESLIQKAELVNRAVENGPEPERVNDPEICRTCDFRLTCLPDQDYGAGAELLTDEDLLGKLRRRDELEPAARQYEALDKSVKVALKGKPLVLIGDYRVEGQEISRKGYEVKPSTYWQTKIVNLAARPVGDPVEQPSLVPVLEASLARVRQ